jgi:putative nucleotidyltransferase with HDIG domain
LGSILLGTIDILVYAGINIFGITLFWLTTPDLKPGPIFFGVLALNVISAVITVASMHNRNLIEEDRQAELKSAYDGTLEGWAKALELRDKETEGHCRRVAELTIAVARRLGVPEREIRHIWRGALLHDIGKMGIPDEILMKPTSLSKEDWEIMYQHPVYAYNLLSGVNYLKEASIIPLYHHERWDGSGYPYGLKGEKIPLPARIFAVVDVWDALLSDRPYRSAWKQEDVSKYMVGQSGVLFDPRVVKAFFEIVK